MTTTPGRDRIDYFIAPICALLAYLSIAHITLRVCRSVGYTALQGLATTLGALLIYTVILTQPLEHGRSGAEEKKKKRQITEYHSVGG